MATVPEYRALLAELVGHARTRRRRLRRNELDEMRGGDAMTATPTPVPLLDPEADDAWRGVAAEDRTDISAAVGLTPAGPLPPAAAARWSGRTAAARCWRRSSSC